MANPTTNYSFAMPTNTDLVKDLPADFETFGQAVDTQMKTNADAAINKSIIDAAGDLIYGTAADTAARLAIGTANQVLTVNSGATAPEWKTSTSEKSILVAQDSAAYIKYFTTGALADGIQPTEDVTYYSPIYLPNFALDRISLRTGSTFSGTATVRLGLYNADATTGKPSTVYLDAGTVSCTAADTNYEITISNTPPAGYYYFAFNMQTAASVPNFYAFTQSSTPWPHCMPTSSTVQATTFNRRYQQTGVTGAFATAASLTTSTSQPFLVAVRIA